MKLFIIGALVFLVTSCKVESRLENVKKSIYCIDGVQYFLFYDNMAPHFRPDGSLYTCEVPK